MSCTDNTTSDVASDAAADERTVALTFALDSGGSAALIETRLCSRQGTSAEFCMVATHVTLRSALTNAAGLFGVRNAASK
jgi:hypothetical protein